MLYSINEVFYSLQGEGRHTGKPVVFVRFSGCNLSCPWCDTDHSYKFYATANDLLVLIQNKWKPKDSKNITVVLTGGEPCVQDLTELLELLYKQKISVHMETNGTLHIQSVFMWKNKGLLEWVTCSPKEEHDFLDFLAMDEVKIVHTYPNDRYFNRLYDRAVKCNPFLKNHMYIAPLSKNTKPAIRFVLTHPEWKLSVQTQKYIDIK